MPGLLYAGTWYGLFVSFDQGKHWQPLQQNLPATPVTDIKVHDNDLVISTMGRGFWIMDDVASLRQVAKARPEAVTLFTPSAAYRMSYVPQPAGAAKPEYPPVGARIDYYLPEAVTGEITLEILDAAGKVVRAYSEGAAAGGGSGPQAPGMMRPSRRGGAAGALGRKAGMNRFLWDLRFPGPWTANTPQGGPFGPLAAPGTYQVKLTVDGVTKTQPLTVKIDPRLIKDGVTPAILVEQTTFNLKVRDAIERGQQARRSSAEGDGRRKQDSAEADTLKTLYDKLVNKPGAYPANMLIAQLQNVARVAGSADQKIGASAFERFAQLQKELAAITSEIDKALPRATAAAAGEACSRSRDDYASLSTAWISALM